MSQIMKTYRVWTGCGGWQRRTTTEQVWRATPHYKGAGIAIGCGSGLIVGGGIVAGIPPLLDIIRGGGHAWPAYTGQPVAIPEPATMALLAFGLLCLVWLRWMR